MTLYKFTADKIKPSVLDEKFDIEQYHVALLVLTWSREITIKRRQVWNDCVLKCKSKSEMLAMEKRLGYGYVELARAEVIHRVA